MKRKDEKEKMEEMHQHKVEQMIKSAAGSAGLQHKNTQPTMWRSWTVVKQRGKNGQNIGNVMRRYRICKSNEEWRKCQEALPGLKEGDVDKASRLYKAKTGTDFHP